MYTYMYTPSFRRLTGLCAFPSFSRILRATSRKDIFAEKYLRLSLIPAKNLWNHMWFQYLKSPRNPRACAVRPRSTHHAGLGLHWGPLLLPQPRAGRYWPPGHRVICDCSWDLMRLPVPMILPKPPPRYRSLVIARIDTNPWCHKHPLGSPVDIRWAWCAVAPL
jgi:hypothetical protein